MAAARRGAYRAEKRQKEIKRLKKQEEKRARQQHRGETPGGEAAAGGPLEASAEAVPPVPEPGTDEAEPAGT